MEHQYSDALMLVGMMCRALEGRTHVFVGGAAPAPATATLLARHLSDGALKLSMLGDNRYWFMSDDFGEVFHNACNGRYDATFFGGGQIDSQSNINLVGIGKYPDLSVRWPGSRGTPLLYMMIPNCILYTAEHAPRVLVPQVDFISAPGTSPSNIFRPGGASQLLTPRCVFDFDRSLQRFRLRSVHGGNTAEDVAVNTGFAYDVPASIPQTAPPSPAMLRALKGSVLDELAEIYPRYAAQLRTELDSLAEANA